MDKSQRKITGLILCGGKGTRLGNKDKGLVPYRGKMLVQHMIDRVKPQVDQLLININQNENEYETFGAPLTTDADNNYRGPLAGVLSAKSKITTEFCFVVPCDMPHIPLNTVERLLTVIGDKPAVAVANRGRVQPLVLLIRSSIIGTISNRLKGKDKSVLGWLESIGYTTANFQDSISEFRNLNEPSEFK